MTDTWTKCFREFRWATSRCGQYTSYRLPPVGQISSNALATISLLLLKQFSCRELWIAADRNFEIVVCVLNVSIALALKRRSCCDWNRWGGKNRSATAIEIDGAARIPSLRYLTGNVHPGMRFTWKCYKCASMSSERRCCCRHRRRRRRENRSVAETRRIESRHMS